MRLHWGRADPKPYDRCPERKAMQKHGDATVLQEYCRLASIEEEDRRPKEIPMLE